MIKLARTEENRWTVYNTVNQKCADIVRIAEYNPLGIGLQKARFRVDGNNGKTIDSMITGFQKARGVAFKHVRGGSI